MNLDPSQPEYTRLYQFYRFLIVPALLWYGWTAYSSVTTPDGVTVVYAEWARIFTIFVGIPITFVIGFAIMHYRPGNIIGPVLIVGAATGSSEAIHALTLSAHQAELIDLVGWIFFFGSNVILSSYFPSGNIHPRWIRPFVYALIAICIATGFTSFWGRPTSYGTNFAYDEPLPNPFLLGFLKPISEEIYQVTVIGLWVMTVAFNVLPIIRYITTTQQERKQLLWVIMGSLLPAIGVMLPVIINVSNEVVFAASAGIAISSVGLPVCIGISVLFYNLWDINLIIRRTLIYAVVSALLAGTYFLIVFVAQSLLRGFFDENNTLLIVLSTLAIAALFNPVRTRVQQVIDRLFYRKRYNAQEILEQFTDHIREAVEPDAIQQQLMQSVADTIQPQTITLWVVEKHGSERFADDPTI